MAFFGKAGNILRQTVSKHVNQEISISSPSIFQFLRCMSTKVFVGGLSYNTDDHSLTEAFSKYGEVLEAKVILDRETGRSRGFGFVTYSTSEDASAAIQALDGQDLHGRLVRVNHANERPRSTGYGGGGYGGGGYGGGGGGYGGGSGGYGGGSGGYGGGSGGYGGGGSYGGGNDGGGGNSFGSGGLGGYGGSGGDSYASGGIDGTGNNVSTGIESQNIGGAGGDNTFAPGSGLGFGDGDQFGNQGSSDNADGGFGRDVDDEPNDYANRRA